MGVRVPPFAPTFLYSELRAGPPAVHSGRTMPPVRSVLFVRWSTAPGLIFCIAVLVRVPVLWAHMHDPRLATMFTEHAAIAHSWLRGQGYSGAFPGTTTPSAWFSPLPTFFLVLLFKYFTMLTSARIVLTLNLFFSAATAVGILLAGKELLGILAAAIAAWIWVFWYYVAIFPLFLDETSLNALLLIAGVWGLLWIDRSRRAWQWLAFGMYWGFSCLVNPAFFSVLFFYWIWLWIRRSPQSVVWRQGIAISIAAFALTLAPWVVRNYLAFGRFIFVRSDLPAEIYYANHEGLGNAPADYSSFPNANPVEYERLGETAYLDEKKAFVIRYIRTHPAEFLRRTRTRIVDFWTVPHGEGFWFVSLGAFVGLALAIQKMKANAMLLAIPMIFFPLVYYLVWAFPRHRHPIEPVILLLLAYALALLIKQAGKLGSVPHTSKESDSKA